jgi:hypothetical protein
LFVELGRAHPDLETDTAEFFTAIGDLYREQQPSSALRAALFQLLAERTDVMLLGTVQDRRGRTVVALAVDSDRSGLPTRYIQMYDPSDGRLLASEDILTEHAGKLLVPIPSVIQYSHWD